MGTGAEISGFAMIELKIDIFNVGFIHLLL